MSKALYRKYRSKSLSEVIGQRHITDILARAIAQNRISHAYLLTGPRGVGKTSVARIMAYEINGLVYDEDATNLDIIEIDAASNNGVEDVRDLREKVQIAPVSAKKKIYIIDEVHMLSKAAFNALLKTLEEPPEHVVFILATTNVEKLPATIISRTQRFSFRPITITDAVLHLTNIAKQENIKIDEAALKLIAERGDGSFRDSISLLDQLSSIVDTENGETITAEIIEQSLGLTPINVINQIIDAVEYKDLKQVVDLLTSILDSGVSAGVFVSQLTAALSERVIEKPQLLPLLDKLIDVTKSPQPELKLLSVLGMAAAPKNASKSVALSAPVYEVSATIAELEEQAVKAKPVETAIKRSVAAADVVSINDTLEPESDQTPGPLSDPKRSSVFNKNAPDASKPKASSIKKPTNTAANPEAFDWAKLIEYTRKNYVALFSVLSKCGFELNGTDLMLYTGNKFYKNKLDDTKYSPLLAECLENIGVFGLDVHTLSTSLPPKDLQAAAIAAIMGGGEEVVLDAA